jgi:hypothetical protein
MDGFGLHQELAWVLERHGYIAYTQRVDNANVPEAFVVSVGMCDLQDVLPPNTYSPDQR